jgi:hypothetical protein
VLSCFADLLLRRRARANKSGEMVTGQFHVLAFIEAVCMLALYFGIEVQLVVARLFRVVVKPGQQLVDLVVDGEPLVWSWAAPLY